MQRTDSLEKNLGIGKDWRQEEKGMTEDEMVGWHHWLHGHEFEQALGAGGGQGRLACCTSWGQKELDMTDWLNWSGTKNPPTMQETWDLSLGWEDPLEKGMATHSSILAWRIPWTAEPGHLQSIGFQRVRMIEQLNTYAHRKIQTILTLKLIFKQVFLFILTS